MNHVTRSNPPYKLRVIIFYIFILLASVGLIKWQLNNSMEIWFYDNDSQLTAHKKTLDEIGEWEWLIVILETKNNIYNPDFLDELYKLSNQVESLDNVRKVISIANARSTFSDDKGLEYRILYNNYPTTDKSYDEKLRQSLLNNPIYIDSLIREEHENITTLLIQDANEFDDGGPGRVNLIENIKEVMDGGQHITNYSIVGTTALNATLNTYSLRDIFTFYPLVFIICILFGWWVFGNWRDLTIALSFVLAVVSTTVSSMVYGGIALNMVTVMLPAILTALSMASVVHLITYFHQMQKSRPDDSSNIIAKQVVRDLWAPCLGSALTTMAGFTALVFTGIVPIIQLGLFAAAGIFLGFLLNMGIIPLLLAYFWSGKTHRYRAMPRSLSAYANHGLTNVASGIVTKNTWPTIFIFSVIATIGMAGLNFLKADSSYLMMFNEDSEIRNAYNHAEQSGFAASSLRILLEMENGLEDPATFFALDKLQQAIDKLPQVTKIVSPLDGFKEIDRAVSKNEDWSEENYLSYERETFAQILFVGELSNNDDLRDMLLPDNKIGQFFVFTDYMANSEARELVAEIEKLISIHLPAEIKASITGIPVLWANMDRQLFSSQIAGLSIMVVVILATLMVATRSLPLSIIGLVANLLPILTIIGLMSWLDIKLDIGTTIIGGIALGMAVDDTIHFLTHYVRSRDKGMNTQDALIATVKLTGVPIVLTSVLIAVCFSVMVLSQFSPTSYFGVFTSAAILLALITDLLLLPAILMAFYHKKQRFEGVQV